MGNKSKSVVPGVARDEREAFKADSIIMLKKGARARIVPVPSTLLDKVTARIPDPKPPVQFIEAKGRDEPNPFDPSYLQEQAETFQRRARAMSDAFIMFGIELVDGVPPLEEWLPKLRYAERKGLVDLSEYDLEDEFELEFVYKCFVAVSSEDTRKVMVACGLLEEQVDAAAANFPGDKARAADPTGEPEA